MNNFKKTFYFTNNINLECEASNYMTIDELTNYYCKLIKKCKPFLETVDSDGKSTVLNPKNITHIHIEYLKKVGDK